MSDNTKHWISNGAWAAVWSAGFGMSVGVFGDAVALTAVTGIAAASSMVWYVKSRRNRDSAPDTG
ncbi:MAG: hypothetical protein L0G70_02375 [Rubrobacter sp.]|nr:hypothetical protein [Rubrobacter sp.]